ncbi:MAG: thioesterase family protein [Alphaproteobacteria bacterium]
MTAIALYRGMVNTWECDVNGHMNVQFYLAKTGEGMPHLRQAIGLTPAVIADTGRSYAAIKALVRYRQEVHAGDPLHVEATIVEATDKTMTIVADMTRSSDGKLSARVELTAIAFDLTARRAMAWAPEQRERIDALLSERPAELRAPGTGGPSTPPDGASPRAPLLSAQSSVKAWECDELGHFSAHFYMDRVTDSVSHMLAAMGLDPASRAERGVVTGALEYDIRFRRELRAGEVVTLHSGLLGLGEKTFRAGHVMREAGSGKVCATFDSIGVCIDSKARRAVRFPDDLRDRAAGLFIDWPPES